MSKEEKAKMLLEVYEHEKMRLVTEYKTKSDTIHLVNAHSNAEKEMLGQKIAEVNNWYEEELKKIEHRFLKAILQMEG